MSFAPDTQVFSTPSPTPSTSSFISSDVSSPASRESSLAPKAAVKAFRTACGACKKSKTKCLWEDGREETCLQCWKRGIECPGVPVLPPRAQRKKKATNVLPTPGPTPPPPPNLSVVSARAKMTNFELKRALSDDLMEVFASHWDVGLPHLNAEIVIDVVRQSISSRSSEPKDPMYQVLESIVFGLAARTTGHPLICGSGNSTPPPSLDYLELDDITADLSKFGAARQGACSALIQRATEAYPADLDVNAFNVQIPLQLAYLHQTLDGDYSSSKPFFILAAAQFRKLCQLYGPSPSREKWEILRDMAELLMLNDCHFALYGKNYPNFTDEEVSRFFPEPESYSFFFGLDYESWVYSRHLEYPFRPVLDDAARHVYTCRIHLFRRTCVLVREPPTWETYEDTLAEFREIWVHVGVSQRSRSDAREIVWALRRRVVEEGNEHALYMANWAIAMASSTLHGPSFLCFPAYAAIRSWYDEARFPDKRLLEESLSQARQAIRETATAVFDYQAMPKPQAVIISQQFLRLELLPDWISVALERLPPERKGEEVTLAELLTFATLLRKASWSYARAGIRLKELEEGIVELRRSEFQSTVEEEQFDMSQYLDLSQL